MQKMEGTLLTILFQSKRNERKCKEMKNTIDSPLKKQDFCINDKKNLNPRNILHRYLMGNTKS